MRSTAGPIRSNPLTRQFVVDLMDEVAAVGRAHGVPLAENYGTARISHADAMAPEMRSSMALDLELGRPLELPWLAGAVVDLGAKKNVPTPCCRAVRDILALYVEGKPA
jgi:2-dehydropantoate 2-reductase